MTTYRRSPLNRVFVVPRSRGLKHGLEKGEAPPSEYPLPSLLSQQSFLPQSEQAKRRGLLKYLSYSRCASPHFFTA
ncbi:hypothetical protein HMPREF1556_00394 [Porphyromonas sp. oral taxon 278 str. W7784]|nr:hypothetical protein HMPREF1556_00394 [Porphyromonas sp. oral taxon 278 str. W7784]